MQRKVKTERETQRPRVRDEIARQSERLRQGGVVI